MNIQILRKNQSSGLEPIFTGKKQYIRTIIFDDSKEKLRESRLQKLQKIEKIKIK